MTFQKSCLRGIDVWGLGLRSGCDVKPIPGGGGRANFGGGGSGILDGFAINELRGGGGGGGKSV
jgi:hypothetical protein